MIKRQIYSKHVQLVLGRNLDDVTKMPMEGIIEYKLHQASKQDMDDAFRKVSGESLESAKLLLERKWLYDCGLTKWYIARTKDDDDPCFIQAVLTSEDNKRIGSIFKKWFAKLKEGEIQLEGAYAFEKYRGSKLCHSIATDIWDIYKKRGFKKMIIYVKKDNLASLRAAEKTGFRKFMEVPVRKILFFTMKRLYHNNTGKSAKSQQSCWITFRNLAKKNRSILKFYHWSKYLRIASVKEIICLAKDTKKRKLLNKVKPYTMLGYKKLSNLYDLSVLLEETKTAGDFVECGVRNGGSAAVFASVAKENGDRQIWLYDSWEGFPEAEKRDVSRCGEQGARGSCCGSEETVKELFFGELNLDSSRVRMVNGWFEDTMPKQSPDVIALLHLDCDLYKSVKFCLEQLYDKVISGGYIVIDDYGYWKGCKEAVDEFLKNRSLNVELTKIDQDAVCFCKPETDAPACESDTLSIKVTDKESIHS